MSRKRPWLAAGLAVLYPGVGHVYLRAWLRALAWFGLAFLTATVVVPESVLQAGEQGGARAFYDAFVALDPVTILPLLVVNALNAVDAYLTARRSNERSRSLLDGLLGGGGPLSGDGDRTAGAERAGGDGGGADAGSCPNCGRDLDGDIDFCPWCTTRLEGEGEGDADGEEPSTAR